jgi:hypothetical protein
VASTIPGMEKITWKPASATPANQPFTPHRSTSETPTITGDTAKGRSTMACTTPRPGKRPRASASAVTRPNTTLSGTTMATIVSDMEIAAMLAGVVTDSQNATKPSSNVRKRIIPSGTRTSTKR